MKKAFSIIELVFAIVILAICTMAIPNIVSQTVEANAFAIKQELILNAKTLMAQITKSPWDSSYKIQGNCALAPDPIACGIVNFDPVPIYTITDNANLQLSSRNGIVLEAGADSFSRTFQLNAFVPALYSQFGIEQQNHSIASGGFVGTYNDIDDYDEVRISLENANAAINSSGDFILDTNLDIRTYYVSDVLTIGNYNNSRTISAVLSDENAGGLPNMSNIKLIRIAATTPGDPNTSIILRSYAFNIGSTFASTRIW